MDSPSLHSPPSTCLQAEAQKTVVKQPKQQKSPYQVFILRYFYLKSIARSLEEEDYQRIERNTGLARKQVVRSDRDLQVALGRAEARGARPAPPGRPQLPVSPQAAAGGALRALRPGRPRRDFPADQSPCRGPHPRETEAARLLLADDIAQAVRRPHQCR